MKIMTSKRRIWIFDIETFKNTFSLVAKEVHTEEYLEFIIHEDDTLDHANDLFLWLYENPILIGYNNLDFDGQIVEEMYQKKLTNARDIYNFSQQIIETKDKFKLPYKQWTFSHVHLDLMALSNYGIYGKPTSLKWLEFTMREQSIKDLPFDHTTELDESQLDDLIRYNRKDVDVTFNYYKVCRSKIDMREVLKKKYGDPIIMNQPNSSIGAKIVLNSYCAEVGVKPYVIKKKHTKRKEIQVADVILNYIKFSLPLFQEVKRDFQNLVLKADKHGKINIKGAYKKEIRFQNMDVNYALGGIHGCVPSGIYKSTDTHVIKTYDVTSMYPNIAISNGFYPKHLGPEFCKVFKNILIERRKYPKDKDPELNAAYKEAANSVNINIALVKKMLTKQS